MRAHLLHLTRPPLRRTLAGGALAMVALACGLVACGGLSEDAICQPGTTIFCRCPAGDPGEKVCAEDGLTFSECGGCEDRADPTGGASGVGGGAGSGGGGNPDGAPLYRPCTDGLECESGLCRYGYCTHACDKVSDCEFGAAECVPFGGVAVCMPVCSSVLDCEPYGTPPSMCGYAPAIDNWGVTVCANWGSDHTLVPDDTDCTPFEHGDCNLGYAHRKKVCSEEGLCATGCFSALDCPNGETCDSDATTVGACH